MKENCLVLNSKKGKTEFVMFAARVRNEPVKVTIDGNVINQPDLYEYLGVKLDSHLNMNFHYEQIYKRVSSRIKLLKRVRHQISTMVAETIFNSMILPLLFYCYPIFGGMNNTWLRTFESLMQKAKSIIKMRKKWPTFNTQLRRKIAIDVFKSLNAAAIGKYDMINHSINTRGNNCKRKIRSEAGRKLSYYQGALIFNFLPENIRKENSFILFKNLVNNYDF